jgi:hypothetical protein
MECSYSGFDYQESADKTNRGVLGCKGVYEWYQKPQSQMNVHDDQNRRNVFSVTETKTSMMKTSSLHAHVE